MTLPQGNLLNQDVLKGQVIELARSLGLEVVEVEPDVTEQSGSRTAGYGQSVAKPRRSSPDKLTVALAWVAARNGRDKAFGADLFMDPAWNILLDLYVNHCRNRSVAISDLCLASQTSATTALRWIALLEKRGLLRRVADPADKRRWFMCFTDDGMRRMEQALANASDSDRKLGLGRLRVL